jgi:catechol 2,3-dioxygenase-like lactoylglutathione lyase family enzyme
MLLSPSHVIIGTRDRNAQIAWWTALGFVAGESTDVSAEEALALYGLGAPTTQTVLSVDGATSGHIVLVDTTEEPVSVGPWDRGPHAIDLYTVDMARSLAAAADAGGRVKGHMRYEFGTMALEEGKSIGPDGTVVVFIQNSKRRPSVLDAAPERLHSEVHSVVNIVASVDAARRSWIDGAGLDLLGDAVIDSPGLADLMELPKVVAARMGLFCDAEVAPIRFEVLEFVGLDASEGRDLDQWPLKPGLPMVRFTVADLAAEQQALEAAGFVFGEIVATGTGSAVCATDPSGLRFQLSS